ncbi:MAG: hypothetical protein WCK28_20490, partial [Burkholderiales bacterium]
MAVPSSRARRLGATLLVLALSVAMHAWMVLALDGRLSASRPASPEPPVVEVALTAPPPAVSAPAAASRVRRFRNVTDDVCASFGWHYPWERVPGRHRYKPPLPPRAADVAVAGAVAGAAA